jgi:hypothetical protein
MEVQGGKKSPVEKMGVGAVIAINVLAFVERIPFQEVFLGTFENFEKSEFGIDGQSRNIEEGQRETLSEHAVCAYDLDTAVIRCGAPAPLNLGVGMGDDRKTSQGVDLVNRLFSFVGKGRRRDLKAYGDKVASVF